MRQDELNTCPVHRDGYRTRYAPPGSAPDHIDRAQPSLQEFLDSSEDHFPASGTDTALNDDIKKSRLNSAYNTFSSKKNVKSSRSPSDANTFGLKENVKSSSSPSTLNTSTFKESLNSSGSPSAANTFAPKANITPSGSPSFATLRHKLSSVFSGEASGRDDYPSQATPPMPTLAGNYATTPVHERGVFGLSDQLSQAPQIQATSADVARLAAATTPTKIASTATSMSSTDTASPVNIAGSAATASPKSTGGPISTSDFAAKVRDKASRSQPLLTVDTTRSTKAVPASATSSSAYGQPRNRNDDYGSSKTGERSKTRPNPTDPLSLTHQDTYEDEVPIYTRSHPIVNEFAAGYLGAPLEISAAQNLIAAGESSPATTEPSSSFMSPTRMGKALRRNLANLKIAKPDSTYSKSNADKGAGQSSEQAGSSASDSVYRNWDANKGTVRSLGKSSIPQVNPYREQMYSQPPSPEISRFSSTSTATTDSTTSPTSPRRFRILRKSVGSGDPRAVSTGKKVLKKGESSTSGAQGKETPEEYSEEEDFVAFKVSYQLVPRHCYCANRRTKVKELREQTGSQIVWYTPDDLRCRHPNHHRTWYSKNLWCAVHAGACANCGAPCCAMAGAIKIVDENRGSATAVAAAKALSQAISLYVPVGSDETTLMECTSCHHLVCPECCSVCPVAACGDRVCNAPVSDYS